MMGTAYKNKGVQELLDAVIAYLPSPLDRQIDRDRPIGQEGTPAKAERRAEPNWSRVKSPSRPNKPLVGMAFKIVEDPFGQLTFMRIYQGKIKKGETLHQHAHRQKQIASAGSSGCTPTSARKSISAEAGDIVAVMGVDCARGDTFCGDGSHYALESMFVPEPVIRMAIEPLQARRRRQARQGPGPFPPRRSDVPRHDRRRNRPDADRRHGRVAPGNLRRAHPPRVQASNASIGEPQGRLPRIRRPRRPSTTSSTRSRPAVRASTPTSSASWSRCRKTAADALRVRQRRRAGTHSEGIHPAGRKGFPRALAQGAALRVPSRGRADAILEDGTYHDVDSSEMAFNICGCNCIRETFMKAKLGAAGADHEDRSRSPDRIPGTGHRPHLQQTRH